MKTTTRAHIAVLCTNLFFAGNYSLVKYISPSVIKPFGLNLARVGISLLLFWILWLSTRVLPAEKKIDAGIRKKDLGRFILSALCGVALNQMLFIKGLTMTSTIHASLLSLCTPLLITILAFWILKEKVTIPKLAGLVLGIGGALVLIMSKEKHGTASLTGDILIILNATAYTIYFILVKPLMNSYPPIHVMRWVFTLGFFMVLPFCWTDFYETDWSGFDLSHALALTFICFCGTFLAYTFNIFGIRHLGAGVTGAYIYTQPLFTVIIALIFLHEHFTFQKGLAGLLIFAGVFLVGMKKAAVAND